MRVATAAGLVVALTVASVAGSASAATPNGAGATIQADVDAIRSSGTVGVNAEIVDHGVPHQFRAGVARLGSDLPVPYDGRYRTGSVTKTMVAVVVLQLVTEGRLSLDDTVDHWLPGVVAGNGNDGTQITVRQLLNHTSGLFDYSSDQDFAATLASVDGYTANRLHHYAPAELIQIGLAHPPYFAPGAGFAYSNTNYVLLGQVIQAVTGKSWAQQVYQRIIWPLGLSGTSVPGDDPTIPGPHADGYHIYSSDPDNRVYTDTTVFNMSWAGSAGSVITTTADESRFVIALLSGRLLPSAQLAQMETTVQLAPGFGYGLGLINLTLNCSDGSSVQVWGHDGSAIGYATYAFGAPAIKRSVVISMTTTTFSDAQFLSDSAGPLNQFLSDAFCVSNAGGAVRTRSAPARQGAGQPSLVALESIVEHEERS